MDPLDFYFFFSPGFSWAEKNVDEIIHENNLLLHLVKNCY